jgi:ADP-ribose pyrophosphatase
MALRPTIGVGGIVMREDKVLLVQRAAPPFKGLWTFPGGTIEWKETLKDALEREIFEETGLTVRAGQVAHVYELIHEEENHEFHFIIIELIAEYVEGALKAASDASDARWISSSDLGQLQIPPETMDLLQQIFSPAYPDEFND